MGSGGRRAKRSECVRCICMRRPTPTNSPARCQCSRPKSICNQECLSSRQMWPILSTNNRLTRRDANPDELSFRVLPTSERTEHLQGVWGFSPGSQGHNLAVTVLCVPSSLDSGNPTEVSFHVSKHETRNPQGSELGVRGLWARTPSMCFRCGVWRQWVYGI